MVKRRIINELKGLVGHDYIEIVQRGNAAINAAVSIVKGKTILIPAEGGWLHYKSAPKLVSSDIVEVKCDNAKINLDDLKEKLSSEKVGAFLYHNPGGYFVEQEIEEIYDICKKRECLVILDVSGGIGTRLCDGSYADVIVGSFGKWKLVDAGIGGFISCKNKTLFDTIDNDFFDVLEDETSLLKIMVKLEGLSERIKYLEQIKDKVVNDLLGLKANVISPNDFGFVVMVKFDSDKEKEKLISYCVNNNLEWTECPRYIRLMSDAISIEIKRL